jgi:hypothetical protein
MDYVRNVNRFFYSSRFSIFEALWIIMIGYLVSAHSPWWYLLLLPTTLFSIRMERTIERDSK